MTIRYTKKVTCPLCGHLFDSVSPGRRGGVAVPTPGDLSLCFGCAAILVFDTPPAVHAITDVELAALDEDTYEEMRWHKQNLENFLRERRGREDRSA